MNTGGLNIAHIGGKPVIIANNAAIGTNQGITVSTSHLHNNGVNKGTPAGTMLLTSNTNSISPALEQQNSNDMVSTFVSYIYRVNVPIVVLVPIVVVLH